MKPPVEAPTSMHTRPATSTLEVVERVHELLAPAAHEGAPRPHFDRGPRGDQDASLIYPLPIHEHLARKDLPGGLFAAFEQPLVDEQTCRSEPSLDVS